LKKVSKSILTFRFELCVVNLENKENSGIRAFRREQSHSCTYTSFLKFPTTSNLLLCWKFIHS